MPVRRRQAMQSAVRYLPARRLEERPHHVPCVCSGHVQGRLQGARPRAVSTEATHPAGAASVAVEDGVQEPPEETN
eukprot:6444972-Alexandrium_andersonii.AAC.1